MACAVRLLTFLLLCTGAACSRSKSGSAEGDDPGGANSASAGAQVEDQVGEVVITRDRVTRPLTLEALRLGDGLSVGAKGAVGIRFKDGWRVEMGPEARMVLRGTDGLTVLEVTRGIVLARLKEGDRARSYLTILTPFGFARVGPQPSEATLSVGTDAVEVTTGSGSVEFVARSGGTVATQAGERLRVSMDGVERLSPRAPTRVPTAAWVVPRGPRGVVEARKGSGIWKTVPRSGQALEVGDAVRVRDGEASVQWEGTQIKAIGGDGSEWVLGPAGSTQGRSEASLELLHGGLDLSLADPRSRLRVSGLELDAEAPAQLRVAQGKSGLEVVAIAGDLMARSRGVERPLEAGGRATLPANAALRTQRAEKPVVTIPSRASVRVFKAGEHGLDEAALSWDGPSGDYDVVVATEPTFKDPIVSGRVHNPWVRVPVPSRGGLYWRVTSATGEAVAKGSATFLQDEPTAPGAEIERVRTEVKDGGEATTLFFQERPQGMIFTYGAEPRATSYRIQIFALRSLSRPVVELNSKGTAANLAEGALGEGRYAWSVTPLSASGEELRGGRMNRLTLSRDPSVSALTIRSPQNGAASSSRVQVAGAAPTGTQLQVNGKPVSLDGKGRFESWVAPMGDPPLVVFRASRGGDPEMIVVRILKSKGD